MSQRGKTQLDDLLGALADLTLKAQTHQCAVVQHTAKWLLVLFSALLLYLDLWGEGGQVEGEHRCGTRSQKVNAV